MNRLQYSPAVNRLPMQFAWVNLETRWVTGGMVKGKVVFGKILREILRKSWQSKLGSLCRKGFQLKKM